MTKSEVLGRGWTETAIERLLGEPDRIRLNHLYKEYKDDKIVLRRSGIGDRENARLSEVFTKKKERR